LDLDATNTSEFQYTEFSGFESYILNNPSNLAVISTNAPLIRFVQTINGRRENVAQDQVQVEYSSISTFSVKIGNVEAGLAYFGVLFEQVTFPNGANLSTVSNPGNVPPTSANDTKFVTSGVPMTLNADLNAGASSSAITDFGDYQDADGQSLDTIKIVTLPATGNLEYWNGTAWIAVVQNQSIPGTDLAAGNLRYTAGGVDSSFDFIVNDGIVDSLTTYTLTLRVAQQAQIIEVTPHATPGTSVTPIVTATSGNTPILSSQTLGACTVSGGVISVVGGVTTGVCVIQISEPGDSTFAEAPVTELRINISGGNLSTIPTVITNAPTNVQDGSAQLEGSVNPNGLTTTVTFVYGTSPLLSSGNTSVTATQSPLTAGTANVAVSNSVTGLPVGTYFYRTIATSSGGVVQGVIRSFVVTASSNSVAATTTVAPSTTTAVSVTTVVVPTSPAELSGPTRSTLPRTGNSRNDLLLLAGVLYAMGSALLVMSRRRRINGSY
jgi:LPXTG-motif cell wall-anchored protein